MAYEKKDEKKDETNTELYEKLVNDVKNGKNVFLTGPGGSGKSYNISKLKKDLPEIIITSTTGVSSVSIGGITIHSFCGIGIIKHSDDFESILKRVKKSRYYKLIKTCKYLVIDEISMLGADYFDVMNDIFKVVRECENPFGGIQLILTGDFLQLPSIGDKMCFKSDSWKELDLSVIYLQEVFRFTDKEYSDMLSRLRLGKGTYDDNKKIYERFFAYKNLEEKMDELTIKPSFLFGKRVDVYEKNLEELNKLPGNIVEIKSIDSTKDKQDIELLENVAPRILHIKKGAQVMINVNLDVELGLVNGTRGAVHEIFNDKIYIKLINNKFYEIKRHDFMYEKPLTKLKIIRQQFPLILAFSLSIHKIQGASLDSAVIDLGNSSIFEASQAYVALSRVRSFEGLYITKFNPNTLFVNKDALEFYTKLIPASIV